MQAKYLVKTLIVPLSIATVFACILSYFFPWQGFFVNLATTFIGILATVFYVDFVLRKHEEMRWADVKVRIHKRLESFANSTITQFRIVFGFGTDVFDESVLQSGDLSLMRSELIKIAEHVLNPAASSKIEQMNQVEWKKFAEKLQSVWQIADRLVEMFGNKLEPEIFSSMFDIQDKTFEMLSSYATWPDIYGVPDDQLPPSMKISPAVYKQALNKMAARNTQEILSLAANLLRKLHDH